MYRIREDWTEGEDVKRLECIYFTLSFPIFFSPLMVAHCLISVCTAQYAELGLIFIMRFVEMRTVLVLMPHLAVSKPDEILIMKISFLVRESTIR